MIIFEILVHAYTCENNEYLASIIIDSVLTSDEIIEPTKNETVNVVDEKQHVK